MKKLKANLHRSRQPLLPEYENLDEFNALVGWCKQKQEDMGRVRKFISLVEDTKGYLGNFRPSDILTHVRVWDQWKDGEHFWLAALRSRTRDEQIKVWYLGEDGVGLNACFSSLFSKRGINLTQINARTSLAQVNARSVGARNFAIISVHLEISDVERVFGQGRHDLRTALKKLVQYLQKGLAKNHGKPSSYRDWDAEKSDNIWRLYADAATLSQRTEKWYSWFDVDEDDSTQQDIGRMPKMPSTTGLSIDIGPAIRELRELRGLTQSDLTKKAHITINFLSAVENGRREASLKVLGTIADVLQIPLPWIVSLATKNDLKSPNKVSCAIENLQSAIREEVGLQAAAFHNR